MIRSKHNNLMNYFIHDERDLSPAYVKSSKKFLKEISHKPQAASAKLQEGIDYEVDNIDDYIKRVKSNKRLETDTIKR